MKLMNITAPWVYIYRNDMLIYEGATNMINEQLLENEVIAINYTTNGLKISVVEY